MKFKHQSVNSVQENNRSPFEDLSKEINAVCLQDAEILNVTSGRTYNYFKRITPL